MIGTMFVGGTWPGLASPPSDAGHQYYHGQGWSRIIDTDGAPYWYFDYAAVPGP